MKISYNEWRKKNKKNKKLKEGFASTYYYTIPIYLALVILYVFTGLRFYKKLKDNGSSTPHIISLFWPFILMKDLSIFIFNRIKKMMNYGDSAAPTTAAVATTDTTATVAPAPVDVAPAPVDVTPAPVAPAPVAPAPVAPAPVAPAPVAPAPVAPAVVATV